MLITPEEAAVFLRKAGIEFSGVFHIGAHDCEELSCYEYWGIDPSNVIWIDAIEEKVERAKVNGIPNVYRAVITDKDDGIVVFHESNNVQ